MIRLSICLVAMAASAAANGAIAQEANGVSLQQNNLGGPDQGPARTAPPSGNPLWEIPLAEMSVTQERPIFSPSRRPLAQADALPPVFEPPPPPVAIEAAPEKPVFTLVGTIMGTTDQEAIFMDPGANSVVRLHIGEAEAGWVLRSVERRTTTLEKNQRQVTLALPPPKPEPGDQAPGFQAPSFQPPGYRPPPGAFGR